MQIVGLGRRNIPSTWKSKCKSPEVGVCCCLVEDQLEVSVAEAV